MRTPLTNDAELQARDQLFLFRQHAYELTQKLTYFVISIELIFCGYMLLNAEKLSSIQGASYLFVTCGIAAFFGIFWRFFYNQTYHNHAHGIQGALHQFALHAQTVSYWIYVSLSIAAFVWALVAGFAYLNKINPAQKTEVSKQINQPAKQPASLAPKTSPKQSESQAAPVDTPISKEQKSVAPSQQATTVN
jgi:hypothetical protein